MATQKEVKEIVALANANREAAKEIGLPNTAPWGQIKILAKRDIKTDRFTLYKGETWEPQYARFEVEPGYIELGVSTLVPIKFIEILGLAVASSFATDRQEIEEARAIYCRRMAAKETNA